MVRSARALLAIELKPGADPSLVPALAAWLPRGGRSVVEASVPMAGGGHAIIRLGQDFTLKAGTDAEDFTLKAGTDAEIATLPGVATARISALAQPLRLVA
jgi:hypothetical protein